MLHSRNASYAAAKGRGSARRPAVIYISYDGMLEPLGESQVIGYLEPLARSWRINLISFEKPDDLADARRMVKMEERLRRAGISWRPLRYHKSPSALATSWDIARGTAAALAIARRHRASIIHARSYVPAVMALAVKRLTGARFIFDMRGFWADERVDGGLWPRDGRLYHTAKMMERRFLLSADHVVTLTRASAREIANFDYLAGRVPPITVIPTCADLDRFRPRAADPARPFTLGYVGSVGTWYLFDETLAFFNILRRYKPEARLLVVNRGQHDWIREKVRHAKIPDDRLELLAVHHEEVPEQIAQMHAAVAFIRPCYSKIASAATKVGEYLGCGVPCVGNIGVGDMAEILGDGRAGVVLSSFEEPDLVTAAHSLLKLAEDRDASRRCAGVAAELFCRDKGVASYTIIYENA